MSEQEKQSSGGTDSSPIAMVDHTESNVKPYRPTDIQETDLHHKRSRAPAVPTVAEELKNLAENAITNQSVDDSKELMENEHAMSSEHPKHNVSKKTSKRRDTSPDIPLQPLGEDAKKETSKTPQPKHIPTSTQPIPAQIVEEKSAASVLQLKKEDAVEDDSITEEVAALHGAETKAHTEWSDDEEAGGLPRCESRASRMSRAVRQLFCCGVRYEPASEDNISSRSGFHHAI